MAPDIDEQPARTELAGGRSPETVDRLMVGVCGAIWLALLAASVFAAVELVRLASGHPSGGEQGSSWLLYAIIVISALVILGAIPLLLRAPRTGQADVTADDSPAERGIAPALPAEAATEKMRIFGVDPYARRQAASHPTVSPVLAAIVGRLWLRGTVSLLGAIGLALTAVAVGAYLLAVGSDTAAWVAMGLAGAITVAMPAVLAFFQRQLGEAIESVG